MMQLSIIIPVYNVENYIRPCLESILRQGVSEDCFEVILVNDGTKDKSIEVVKDIIGSHQNFTVITQENQGVSMARNNGMRLASGEYIMFVDSDDLLIDNSLHFLLTKAISSKADIVYSDFVMMDDNQIENLSNNIIKQKDGNIQEKTGEELLIQDLSPHCCYVWRSLYRKEFLVKNNLSFIPNIVYEDVAFTHQCYAKAKQCLKCNWFLIIYRIGHLSITSSFNKKKGLDYCIAIANTWNIKDDSQLSIAAKNKIKQDVYVSFSVLMCSITHSLTIPVCLEILLFLLKMTPDLYFSNSIKQRLLSFFMRETPPFYIFTRFFYAKYFEDRILPFYHHKLKKIIK